jgi:sugar phosphate isomerase/epimerase
MSRFILSAFGDEISPNLTVQMDVLEQNDIRFIEVRGVNGRNIVQYSSGEALEIKKQLDARGFRISAIGSPFGKIGIEEDFTQHLELFRHTLELAHILETGYIRVFSFYPPSGADPADHRSQVMDRFSQFIRAAEGTGITLLHENEKDIYGDTPERCLDLLETMNCSYVGAVFDPANFVQCDVKTFPEAYELLKKHIRYMHIKDAVYSDHHVVPAGYGDGKVKEILRALYISGYDGFLSIEPHLWDFVGYADLEPRSHVNKMEDGGPKQFAMAAEALRKIIAEIEAE